MTIISEPFSSIIPIQKKLNLHSGSMDLFTLIQIKSDDCKYGFILREKNVGSGDTNRFKNVMVESIYYSQIKKFMYTKVPSVEPHERIKYNVISAFLSIDKISTEFIKLFPDFSGKFKIYNEILNNIITCCLMIMRNKQNQINKDLNCKTLICEVAAKIADQLVKREQLDRGSDDYKMSHILRDKIKVPSDSMIRLFMKVENDVY